MRVLIAILLMINTNLVIGKTIQGVLNSKEARLNNGQYITSFCFYGDGYCKYDLPKTSNGMLYFFTENKWNLAKEILSCQDKLAVAEFSFALSNVSGEIRFVPWKMINFWHVVYADVTTCDNSVSPLDDISYTIQLLNKDVRGNPTEHFSYEEMGVLPFYKIITFVYFITASLYGQRLWQTINKGGPMHQVIKELSVGVIYHGLATLFMLTNLLWFSITDNVNDEQPSNCFLTVTPVSPPACNTPTLDALSGLSVAWLFLYAKDGVENSYLSFVVLAFYLQAEFKMLCMTIKVSFGWMLGSSKNILNAVLLNKIYFAVGTITILELFLVLWNYLLLLCCIKCLVAAVVVLNIKAKLSEERSSLRKDFYTSVIKSCCLWFLGLPSSALLTLLLPSYYRLRIITFGQRAPEMIAVFLLYKVFLSRSLYWEVSSLSSATLPLRLDKAFGKKTYQTYNN